MIKIKYFVHGATADNIAHCSTGWKDLPLIERGIAESKATLDGIRNEQFDLVVCSDLLRAKQSAEVVFGNRFPIVYDARIRECNYGDLNGAPSSSVVYDEHIKTPFPNGEALVDVEKRVYKLLVELNKKYPGKKIAFMAHRAPQLALEKIINHKTWKQAIQEDWRKTKSWQPGWEYEFDE